MRSLYENEPQRPLSFPAALFKQNLPTLLFLVIGLVGMVTVYAYFKPDEAAAEALIITSSINRDSLTLAAPIYKVVPERPVLQRLTQSPGPVLIGLIVGHQDSDTGAICDDGLTEVEINRNIANKVANSLYTAGIPVQLLSEFDPRLTQFSGTALVSIHADSCGYYNDQATGYKIAGSSYSDSSRLELCVEQAYYHATQLPYHANTITTHMTDYHAFREIAPGVPAIIIEVGFMNLDRVLLTTQADLPAAGIANGIQCFMEGLQ